MNKDVFEKEKEYLSVVKNQISSDIAVLDKYLATEKIDIQNEKFNHRSTHATREDVDDSFLDIYMRETEYGKKVIEHSQLKRMLKYPYFGKVDVVDNSNKSYFNYIGYKTLYKPDGGFYIIDWRAPFSSLFYDYDKGPYSYKTISGVSSGQITNKRQFKLENSELKYYFDSDLKVDDDILQKTLSGNTTDKMKNIVATIQREQNKIIRCSEKLNTLVLGVAGSGKTSIALHRVAYLLYKLKDKLKSSEVMILSPNDVFSGYISEVLPELNEQNAVNTTMHNIIKNELGEIDFESKHEQTERKLLGKVAVDPNKQTYEFLLDLYNFIINYAKTEFKPEAISMSGFNITQNKIAGMYFRAYSKLTPYYRVDYMVESLFDSFFANFEKAEFQITEFLKAKIYKMFTNNNPINIYKKFLNEKNKTFALINKKIKYEDIVPILFINYCMYGSIDYSSFKHLVIDETQDYSAIELFLLNSFFDCNKTIVGDIFQATDKDGSKLVLDNLKNIFSLSLSDGVFKTPNQDKQIEKLVLTKSYRSSYQITNLANSILNRNDCEPIMRESVKPSLQKIKSASELVLKLNKMFVDYKQKGYNNIGIITKTRKSAKELFDIVSPHIKDLKHITSSDNFDNGIVILDAFLSKGLEFDAVVLFNVNNKYFNTDLDKQLLYVAVTRALHEITILYTQEPCEFLLNYFSSEEL